MILLTRADSDERVVVKFQRIVVRVFNNEDRRTWVRRGGVKMERKVEGLKTWVHKDGVLNKVKVVRVKTWVHEDGVM